MGSVANNSPLIVIVGQTASGKSALAMQIAQQFDGEIIAADSRTVYTGMDIGTAKPSAEDQRLVKHHLLDVVEPGQLFSVADFQKLARVAIADIAARGKLPILVGGTGLYVDAVIYNFSFRQAPTTSNRQKLQNLSVSELQELLSQQGIALPENRNNQRHLIRALEAKGELPTQENLRSNTLVIGIAKPMDDLEVIIQKRVDAMVQAGLVEEVRTLGDRYGWETVALQAPAYKAFRPFLAGQLSLEAAKQLFVRYDRQYAKRQKTWFKRNPDIVWISKSEDAVDLVTTLLNK